MEDANSDTVTDSFQNGGYSRWLHHLVPSLRTCSDDESRGEELQMKNLARLMSLLFAFALVAAACGSDSASDGSDEASESTETTVAEAEESAEESDEATDDAMSDDADTDDAMSDDEMDAMGDYLVDLEGREIVVAVENAYLPFNYIDAETGEPGGWDYAALADICARLNCTVKYETFDWDPMIQAVSAGQFDVAADGITITEERAEIVDFSVGYINLEQRILVAIDSEIDSIEALKASDCKMGTQAGTTNFDTAVELVGEDRIQAMDEFGFVIQSVVVGDICAAIIDETAGQGYVGENSDKIKLVGESLSSDELGFIFPKGSDLVEPFNLAINAMKEDGTMESLGQEYFSDSFTITYDDID